MKRVRVLGIPSPGSGPAYWWWLRLYRAVRQLRHLVGLHDWNGNRTRCTWCGRAWNA